MAKKSKTAKGPKTPKNPSIKSIPSISLNQDVLQRWGQVWRSTVGSPDEDGNPTVKKADSFDKKQGMDFGKEVIDPAVASALATMLGGIPIVSPQSSNSLLPPPEQPNCVEVGDTKVVGGVRAQNFDIAYRPDGIRIAYDSKTLNGADSIRKNWNNMINDIATEATTVHTRFPYALLLFVVTIPKPALHDNQATDILRTLDRMNGRNSVLSENHLAESIAFIVWDPDTGEVDASWPPEGSDLRIENFTKRIEKIYSARYAGLPPHTR